MSPSVQQAVILPFYLQVAIRNVVTYNNKVLSPFSDALWKEDNICNTKLY